MKAQGVALGCRVVAPLGLVIAVTLRSVARASRVSLFLADTSGFSRFLAGASGFDAVEEIRPDRFHDLPLAVGFFQAAEEAKSPQRIGILP